MTSGLFFPIARLQHVGTAERVTSQHLRDLHHLFLVQDHAVGRLQDGFEVRVRVLDFHAAVLAIDEVVDHAGLQRPRAEQRDQRDDVFEVVRLQAVDQVFHAARFELEHRAGVRRLQQLESIRIVERESS